ncbi:PAS domain-containing sensor histidine kinase [candidate division WWE3 bacterium]|jgi:PAS domain S-box-containing protein|uniref:histidine kinase n=1 Tax=candidate division WWE3 bacterium TaxID=2053526 RepID=A0A3A4ZDT0_UNCKA|nr:MAG: PAS domain-containing sensor histidine kinase [candidate division WWE3 bacterium]
METAPPSWNNEDILSLIVEQTTDMVAIHTFDWVFLYVSPSSRLLLGYEPDELLNKSAFELFHPDDLKKISSHETSDVNDQKIHTITYRIKRKGGGYVWFETTVKPIKDLRLGNELRLITVSRDVTSRKNSEEMVKKFVQAVESASDSIVMANSEGIIMYTNPAIYNMTGYKPPEVIGKHANFIWEGTMDKIFLTSLWHNLREEKKPFNGEITNVRKDGMRYVSDTHITPILDEKKDVSFYVGIARDITKAKEVDRMKTEFISLASHQLRTPLTSMKWRLEMLLKGEEGNINDKQKEYLLNINGTNERMIDLVNSLLNISRIESGRLIIDSKPTSLTDLMLSAIDEVSNKAKDKQIRIIKDFQEALPVISVDPKLLRNVYINLLTNAIKYTKEKGAIEVRIYEDNNMILTQVADNGYGIPKSDQDKIFQKFYRADNIKKVETDGTGLGLYLTKAIIEASNGKIWFESEENKGTSFYVALSRSGMEPKKGEVSITV